jgi:transmembrane sensor
MTPPNITPELLDRFLAGEATADERGAVEAWMAVDAARADLVSALTRGPAPDTEAWLARVNARRRVDAAHDAVRDAVRDPADARRPRGTAPSHRRSSVWRWVGLASVAIVPVALFAIARLWPSASHPAAAAQTYATTTGQHAVVTLSDGSRVTLAPRTTLRAFMIDQERRTVVLDGEAIFDVTHAEGVPFIVQTGAVTTRVLGTRFSVRTALPHGVTRVAVLAGKVALSRPGDRTPLILTAGRVGEMGDSVVTSMMITDTLPFVGWANGALVFRNARASEVLAALTRWYGYDVRLADTTLADRTVTIALSTRSSAEAFSALKLVLDVDVTFDGHRVTLTPVRSSRTSLRDQDTRRTTPSIREVGR